MRCIVIAILFALVAKAPASADYLVSTKELERICTSENEMPSCLTYIAGVADQFSFQNYVALTFKESGLPGRRDCIYASIPPELNAEALRDIFLKYLRKRPAMLENPAVVSVGAALTQAYPCPKLLPQ